jgi:metal-responsive CopG/Arc/MetJ family transcriptional regulator
MGRTARLTISLPEELISFADEVAKKKKTSRSKVISACLKVTAENYRVAEMVEGYQAMTEEQKELAALAAEIEHEVLPEWKQGHG